MKYLSICSGIEAASVAWEGLGWEAAGFSEIEPFPCAVLNHRFPTVTNYGDLTKHENWKIERGTIDVICGGTPCQSFSVAGLRAGMADPRGNLALTFLSLCDRLRPEWIIWENVPGVLSSNGGRDLGAFLGALGQLGYGTAYRILDAQYFGVAQRRRRIFVVANLTDWRRAAAVLFEPESLRGDSAKGGKARKGAPAGAGNGVKTISDPVTSKWAKGAGGPAGDECQNLTLDIPPVVIDRAAFNQGEGAQYPPRIEASETMSALVARGPHAVAAPAPLAFTQNSREEVRLLGDLSGSLPASSGSHLTTYAAIPLPAPEPFVKAKRAQSVDDDETWEAGRPAPTLSVFDSGDTRATVAIVTPAPAYAVRRLTPVECERLQGFPDGWTDIPFRGKPASDGPRYKAIGNSMAVPVMRWIGERIAIVDRTTKGEG